jgi:O-succinylbenzoic acid--CoA ligase
VVGDETLPYGTLLERVDRLAALLRDHRLTPGSTFAVVTRSAELLALLAHAAPRAGLALLPIGPALPAGPRGALLSASGVEAVVADDPEAAAGRCLLSAERLLGAASEAAGPALASRPLAPDAVHLVCPTSGTGGTPKGVLLTGDNLRAAVAASASRIPLTPSDAWLACVPLHHVAGLAILYRCAAAGAAVVLHPRFDPVRVLDDLDRRAITHLSLVPAMLSRLLDEAGRRRRAAALRVVLVGGGPLAPALQERARRAGWPVCPTYGLTEAASQVATLCPPPGGDWPAGLVGHPLDGLEVRITAPGPDGAGLIEIRGPMVTVGYAGPGGARGGGPPDGWLATRDLGRIDAAGRLTVIGRADDVLVSGGENVHPVEVEHVLAQCPEIGEVAVSARPDPGWGDRLVAVWTGPATLESVECWAREHLQGAWRPRAFQHLERLPRSGPGKLDRAALRRLLALPAAGK